MENSATIVADDEKAVQNAEGQGRHGEEIHGGNVWFAKTRNFSGFGYRPLRLQECGLSIQIWDIVA